MSTLGQRLRKARENKGWSQTFVCEKLKISNSRLSGYERDYREPDAEMLATLANLYGVSVDYLLGRTDNPNPASGDLPQLTEKDEKDIAKKLQAIADELASGTGLAFDGEPLDETTRELVLEQIESNLRLAKKFAKKKFTPKKYRK